MELGATWDGWEFVEVQCNDCIEAELRRVLDSRRELEDAFARGELVRFGEMFRGDVRCDACLADVSLEA